MKIGILTLPLHTNYGGILQAYALQTILERMGHEVKVLVIKPKATHKTLIHYPLMIGKRCVKKYLLRKNIPIDYNKYKAKLIKITSKYIKEFISNYIKEYSAYSYSTINEDDFDAYIVGSDQVWRKIYFTSSGYSIECAFLNFTKDWKVKRIAYAPSFGTNQWEYNSNETKACKLLLKKFDAVSIREQAGVKLCKEQLEIDALNVLDPTMLLQTSDYLNLIKRSNISSSEGTLHQYILDETPEKLALVNHIEKEKKLIKFSVHVSVNDEINSMEECIQPPIEMWLRAFHDAEYIITDSFHACVFSILFRKQFIAIGNKDRGLSRFQSLLSQFGLEDRLLMNTNEYKQLNDIDYNAVYLILETKREISMNYLINALKQRITHSH